MSGLSIHEKRQLAEQLAREQLNKSGQYRFGIPQSILNAKANEFMCLSDKELQQKFNEYFQSTGLNAKPKDLWDCMGLNLEQKKKAQANMKSLQTQVNKKYMRPTSSKTKKVGANQTTKPLPKDVKKEIRQFMITLLQQTYSQKVEEFRNYLLNNKISFAELGMELHDLGAKVADGLTSAGIVVDRSDTRAEIREKLIDKQAKAGVLADYVDDEEKFNELFKEYFNEDFDYQTTFDYICATNDFSTSESSDKIEKFNKKLNNITKYSIKSADDYMKNASGVGGLLDLAFNVALMCVSGGSSAIAKYAQMTAKGGTELAGKVITNVAGKKVAQSATGQTISQGAGIIAAQTTSAGLNAGAFQVTKTAELAGETLATGEFNTDKAENIIASAEGLFKFGYVGGAISGPLGMQVKNMTTKLLNSKPIINQILTKGITNKPTPLTSVLKDISEHSEAVGEVLKFGTKFGLNAGYMAYDDGVSYTDAMANLAQMDGVSKMVLAMLGAKNMSFLTPEKVQQIKTDLAGYKVNITAFKGQKVYSVKDTQGKETVLSSPEELFMFILDKEAQKVGVKAETKVEAASSKATKNDAKEIDVAQTKNVKATKTTGKKPYVKPELKQGELSLAEPVSAPETKKNSGVEDKIKNTLTSKEAKKLEPMQEQYPEIVNDIIEKYAGKMSNDELIEMAGKEISEKIDGTLSPVQIVNYTPKVEIEMPINETRFDNNDKTLNVKLPVGVSEGVPMPTKIKAELGTTSIHLANEYQKALDSCKEQAEKTFGETKLTTVKTVSTRPKGAASIEPKLEKGLRKNKYLDYDTARECIGDAVGARIITKNLRELSDKEISERINNMKVQNKPLTPEQKELLRKYIYEENFDSDTKRLEGFYLYEQFTRPFVEERTSEVVNELLLSMTKSLMIEKGLTIEQIEKEGILTNKSLIERLKSDDSIEPFKVLQVNNYTGLYGLPEFTVEQMHSIENIVSINEGVVFTRADIGDNLYTNTGFTSPEEVLKTDKNDNLPKSIKASGYRTAQMNVIFKDGTLAEIQFRGEETNKIGEYEHIAYDLRQGKNTLGPLFNDFKEAISKLSPEEYSEYNNYLEACYNYYNRIELGLPAKKPALSSKFDPILSEENMKNLHDKNEARLNVLKQNFKEGKIPEGVKDDEN